MKLLSPLLLISALSLNLSCGGDAQTEEDAGPQIICRERKCSVIWDDDHQLICEKESCTCFDAMGFYSCEGPQTIEEALQAGCCK